jgi:hypothetical protein
MIKLITNFFAHIIALLKPEEKSILTRSERRYYAKLARIEDVQRIKARALLKGEKEIVVYHIKNASVFNKAYSKERRKIKA